MPFFHRLSERARDQYATHRNVSLVGIAPNFPAFHLLSALYCKVSCYTSVYDLTKNVTEVTVRTNYVLIDFESVQTKSLELLTHDHFKVIVFVGANQGKLPFEVAVSLQRLGSRAEY